MTVPRSEQGTLTVLGIQMDIAWESPQENFRRVDELVDRQRERQKGQDRDSPTLLVLPEMFATGFSMNARLVASFSRETRRYLSSLAQRTSWYVLGGYGAGGPEEDGEEEDGPAGLRREKDPSRANPSGGGGGEGGQGRHEKPVNVASIFQPSGAEILRFEKLHPFSLAGEDQEYRAGNALPSTGIAGTQVTALICYDLRFPEAFRPAAEGTDLFCVIANWPHMRRDAWKTLLRARAIENQAFVLGVNRVGDAGGKPHAGDSALIDPMGQVLAETDPYQEGVIVGQVDAADVRRVREKLAFLPDRRPELYRALEEERS